jgi:hypothetical protein
MVTTAGTEIKVETAPTGTNFYGGLINSLRASVVPGRAVGWVASVWTGHTNSGWENTAFPTRMEATVHARRALGLLPAR